MLFVLLLISSALGATSGQRDIFGVTVRWEGKAADAISRQLSTINQEGKEYFDPDCIWRAPNCSNRFPSVTAMLDKLAESFKTETLGYYDVRYAKHGKRDFGGLWQGYALEKIRDAVPGDWLLDISGDIYFSSSKVTKKPLVITDAVFDEMAYAQIDFNAGYVVASVSKRLGGKIKPVTDGEILKVVLFAVPEFSGTRLDAWATGIVAGGKKVLSHLESLEAYRGKWGYFYFEPDGKAHCSSHLLCQLEGPERYVAAVSSNKVISPGTPKRLGGPQ